MTARRRGAALVVVSIALCAVLRGMLVVPVPAAAVVAPSATAPSEIAERDWVRVPGPQPPPGGSIAYDAVRHRSVLFVPNNGASQTWVFDGGARTWTRTSPATNPPMYTGWLAFDAARGMVVLFGSSHSLDSCDTTAGQTWTWDGTTWSQRHPLNAPSECLYDAATTYDAARRVVMLYGKGQGDEPVNWTWDGTNWTSRAVGPLGAAAVGYDPRTRRVLSFGGGAFFHGNFVEGDTFAWDGQRWTRLAAGGGRYDPRPREAATMFYDLVVGAPVLFGGWSTANLLDRNPNNDSWRWTGTHWVRIGTRSSPPPTAYPASAYDVDHHFAVVRSGAETWLFTAATAGHGSFVATASGQVFALGDAHSFGNAAGIRLQAPIIGIARTVTRHGYWLAAADGGIFTFGDARFYGGTGGLHLNQPIVGIAPTPSGLGYWLVARDGGIFAFGDAHFAGSTGNIRLNQPIVGMASTPTGDGYWLVARDGGIFAFGDAHFFGSTGNVALNRPVVGIASTPRGNGYRLVTADGGVFNFGAARFHGAAPGSASTVAIVSSATGDGYWTFRADGSVSAFGDAQQYAGVPGGAFGVVGAAAT